MKKLIFVVALFCAFGCDDEEEPLVYTGNQQQYDLSQGSEFPISGIVLFRERRDNTTEIKIELTGTEGDIEHPAHLHYGKIDTPDAEVAVLLTPVSGLTGESITLVSMLKDETAISYNELINFNGHIKVHLDGGANKSTILAAGNIGSAATKTSGRFERVDIAVCKSE